MPKKNTKNSKKSVKAAVVEEPVVVEPVVIETETETEIVDEGPELFDYSSEITYLQDTLKSTLNTVRELVSHVAKLEKRLNRDKKVVDKKMKGRTKRIGAKTINGFSKPGPVSDALRSFLSLGKDELISRTDVTKGITTYCKAHNLQKEEDKRIILPDTKLRKLLNVAKSDELTYFNLQKYMKVHFPNKEGVYPTL